MVPAVTMILDRVGNVLDDDGVKAYVNRYTTEGLGNGFRSGYTALQLACMHRSSEEMVRPSIAVHLLEWGADALLESKDCDGLIAMAWAARTKHLRMMECLWDRVGPHGLDFREKRGRGVWEYAETNSELLDWLSEHGFKASTTWLPKSKRGREQSLPDHMGQMSLALDGRWDRRIDPQSDSAHSQRGPKGCGKRWKGSGGSMRSGWHGGTSGGGWGDHGSGGWGRR